jgi:hypothetical protein
MLDSPREQVATTTVILGSLVGFALEDGVVYHTYSAYIRGLESLWVMYQWLDRPPKDATRRWCEDLVAFELASGIVAATSTTARREQKSADGKGRSLFS